MAKQRDTFPMRFKRPETKDALRRLAAAQGTTMTDFAERAIEHEIALIGADLERRLTEALDVVRSYNPNNEVDVERWISAAAAGEESGLDPMRDVVGGSMTRPQRSAQSLEDPFGVLAAFDR